MGVNAIIRPPRAEYDIDSVPSSFLIPNYGEIQRIPVQFPNSQGNTIVGSFYKPNEDIEEPSCIIYMHGNASCQLEGAFLVPIFVPAGVSVLCFDFSGCGRSGGEYISLGFFESDDVSCAISFIRAKFGIGRIALWGRSMGAATTFYADREEPTIAGIVCDSPFASLPQLIRELAGTIHVPGCLTSMAVSVLASKIKNIAHFDIKKLEPIAVAPQCFSPIMFIHGEEDDFINPDHSRQLFAVYASEDKEITIVPHNDHNTERPIEVQQAACMFLARVLDAPVVIDDIPMLLGGSAAHHFAGLEDMVQHME